MIASSTSEDSPHAALALEDLFAVSQSLYRRPETDLIRSSLQCNH